MDLQITGLEQVQKALREAGPKLSRLAYLRAMKEAGKVLQAEMQSRAPIKVDPRSGGNSLPPGALKADIQVQASSTDKGGSVRVGPSKRTDHVAGWVELGHVIKGHGRSRKSRKELGHVPARPFMRPALDAAGDAAVNAFTNTLIENLSVLEENK